MIMAMMFPLILMSYYDLRCDCECDNTESNATNMQL